MKFSFRQLEAFRAIAETGSVTRAAARLGISQPATSRLLADFSKAIDIDLFDRQGGNLIPTSEAKYMLAEINRVFEGLNNLEDLRQNLKRRTTGYLRIACLPGFATSHLPGVLARFLRERPGVTVLLEPDRPERILEWIIGEQYDCGITDGFAGHPAIKNTDILIRTVCILPKGHHLTRKSEITPRDLRNEKLVHTRRDSPFFRRLSEAFASYDEQLISWVEVRQFTTACTIVAQGHGVSIVSVLDAEQYRDKGLEMRPFLPVVPHRLSLLRPIRGSQSPVATDFLDTFAQSLTPFLVSEANPLAG